MILLSVWMMGAVCASPANTIDNGVTVGLVLGQ
jgi:hypothetical protein